MNKVAFLSGEFRPLAKIGGLADVAEELPRALIKLGIDVRLFVPRYSHIDLEQIHAGHELEVPVQRGEETLTARVYKAEVAGLPVHLIDGDVMQQEPQIYPGQPMEGERFVFFSIAAVNYFRESGWVPDIVHANDWHTAAAVPYLASLASQSEDRNPGLDSPGTLLTVHNLPYMGNGSEPAVRAYSIPPVENPEVPAWAREIPLPMGIALADHVNTVSPTYAREITTRQYGSGLDGLLASRRETLSGILNGIDPAAWDPETDRHLAVHFSSRDLEKRLEGRFALEEELGWEPDDSMPLLGIVTRLDNQKGVDFTLDALEGMLDVPWRFVLLGTGSHHLENRCADFGARHPGRVKVLLKYDASLARRIYAGSDMILVPSRYEPCGLAQIIGMRYGAVPVVRATGGLKDTVPPLQEDGTGIGFVFEEESAEDLRSALHRAISAYRDRRLWRQLQERAMAADYSWDRSAEKYRDLYVKIAGKARE